MLQRRNRSLPGTAAWTLAALALLAAPAAVTAFERIDGIELEGGENSLFSAVIDPVGEFAYFGTNTEPGRVVKIDLETFQRVDAITLEIGENLLSSAVIDPTGDFAYFGTFTVPGRVVKIDLATFERVGAIALPTDETGLQAAVMDPTGDFAYFGTFTPLGRVVKIDLATFQRVGAIALEGAGDENWLFSATIDSAGEFAYFGTSTVPGHVVKIDLATFQRVDAIELQDGENSLRTAVIDPAGELAYFGTVTDPGRVVKIDLATFQRVGAIELQDGEGNLRSAVIDPAGQFAYFGTSDAPGRVVKVDLETLQRVDAIELEGGEDGLFSAVIDPLGVLAYFGTATQPGRVVKVGLQAFTPVGLAVDYQPLASDGNDVFEPGEQVEMAPAWRNDAGIDTAAGGKLESFTGPGGASYEIVNPGVSYGPVAPGETESCRDSEVACYQMEILLEGPDRPALHWDATALETLHTGIEDFGHSWTLHVGDSFTDVPRNSPFYSSIETVLHVGVVETMLRAGLTGGCVDSEFCPTAVTTRAEMPVFVLKALEGPDFVPPGCVEGAEVFADVPFDSPLCPWIEELASRQVTVGCGGGNYCPSDPVTRAQMAVFLLKTLEGGSYTPPPCTGMFNDVACPSPFADWVEELLTRGVTSGCGTEPPTYCPAAPVTRQQMAAFVTRTFELALYGP